MLFFGQRHPATYQSMYTWQDCSSTGFIAVFCSCIYLVVFISLICFFFIIFSGFVVFYIYDLYWYEILE